MVRRVKGHRLFSGRVYKGKFSTLRSALKVIGLKIIGPWAHAYDANGQPNPP